MKTNGIRRSSIAISGARQNNLKNLDIDIPLNQLTVVTGVSGSGKSSLAFDILYAEGQRRYVESFSAYARQFLDRMDKPQVDKIEGILPAIAIDQNRPVRTSRSTVGTMTELHDHLKLLFAKIGVLSCRQCGQPVERDSAESVFRKLSAQQPEGTRFYVTFSVAVPDSLAWSDIRDGLVRAGFFRLLVAGTIVDIQELDARPEALVGQQQCSVVVDRLRVGSRHKKRTHDSLEQAFSVRQGTAEPRLSRRRADRAGRAGLFQPAGVRGVSDRGTRSRSPTCSRSTARWARARSARALAARSIWIWIWSFPTPVCRSRTAPSNRGGSRPPSGSDASCWRSANNVAFRPASRGETSAPSSRG